MYCPQIGWFNYSNTPAVFHRLLFLYFVKQSFALLNSRAQVLHVHALRGVWTVS